MTGAWDIAGWWPGWLASARLVADVVIVAAGVAVARVLWKLVSGRAHEPPSRRAPGVVVASAALIALCGVSHVGSAMAGGATAPSPAVPTALKVAAAALWAVTAMRFRLTAGPTASPPPRPRPKPSPPSPPPPSSTPAREGHDAREAARPESKVRMLEDVFHDEPWPLDKADALKELHSLLADLEARQCRT